METIHSKNTQRPIFLTILCILTFIWSGINILGNFFNMLLSSFTRYWDLSEISTVLEGFETEFPAQISQDLLQVIEGNMAHGFTIAVITLLLYGINLLGAILMFNMHKRGFYLYLAAQILLLFVAPIFLGWNIFVVFGFIFHTFMTALFITLYAVNLKHMKRTGG